MTLVVGSLVGLHTASAELLGVNWITLEVNGKQYEVPLYNDSVKNEFYWVKKSLEGDKTAREIVLGGQETKGIFIGEGETVRWLFMTRDKEWVKEY